MHGVLLLCGWLGRTKGDGTLERAGVEGLTDVDHTD